MSWKDLIDTAVSQNAESQYVQPIACNLEFVSAVDALQPEATIEPPAPCSGIIGENAVAILENDMLGDAVQQILNSDYSSAERELDLVLQLNHESRDAKFLSNALAKRLRVLSFCANVQSTATSIRSFFAKSFAQGVNSLRPARKTSDG